MFRKIFLILLLFLLFKTSFASNLENNYIEIKPWISWYWKLSKPINKNDLNLSYKLYDIDLFDNSKEDIWKLKNKWKIVICYFSAGSWENWREDTNKFPNSILGKNLDGWAWEKWLDVSRYNLFSSIMEDRIKLAKQKWCDGVEPDNLDVYDNNSWFWVTKKDSIEYFKFLATTAHKNWLVIALKNAPDIVNDLVNIADFSIVESCNKYNECDRYIPFIKKNKAVLNVEYNLSKNKFCSKNIDLWFSPVKACSSLNGCWNLCSRKNNIAYSDNTNNNWNTNFKQNSDNKLWSIYFNIKNTKLYFAPYVDSTLYPFPLISDIAKKTWNKNYILAFITSDKWKCNASWGGYYSIDKWPDAWINSKHYYLYDEVNKVRSQWGKIMISFGWQAWIPLFSACSNEDDLVKEYSKVIDKLKIHDLDFDVEGEVLNNNLATERLIKALFKLQNKYNNKLNIYFTLPVMPEGLTLDWKKLVEKIVKNNLLYAWINLMTMDYGSSYKQDMWDYAIQAVNSTINQLKTIYLNSWVSVSESKLKSILGITPMIWLNDIQSEKFTLEDARQVTQYVKLNWLNRLDYWSLNRDHPCEKNNISNTCSSKNNQTKDFEYTKTFKNWLWNIVINNNWISNKNWTKIQANNKEKSNNNKYYNWNINQTSNINNIENIANDTKNNKWKEKINNIKMENKTFNNKKLNKYYPLFIKFFNIKKKKILSNIGYINSKNYNNLNFFAKYTFWLFTDLNNKYYKNIKSYLWMLKKVIISLKKVK